MKILKRIFSDVGMKIWIFLQLFFLVHRRQREVGKCVYMCVYMCRWKLVRKILGYNDDIDETLFLLVKYLEV